MTPVLRREFQTYIDGKQDHEFLFESRQSVNTPSGCSMAYKIVREAAAHVSLVEIRTHTFRKTLGFHFYKRYKDRAMLQEIFNDSSEDITLRYIGINKDMLDKAMKGFKI